MKSLSFFLAAITVLAFSNATASVVDRSFVPNWVYSDTNRPQNDYYTTEDIIVSGTKKEEIREIKEQLVAEACFLYETQVLLNNGITLNYRFWTPDGKAISTFSLTAESLICPSHEQ